MTAQVSAELVRQVQALIEREAARLDAHAADVAGTRSALLGTISRLSQLAEQPDLPALPDSPTAQPHGLLDMVRSLDIEVAGPLRLSITRYPPDPEMRRQLSMLVTDVPGLKRALLPVDLLHEAGGRQWLAARALAGEEQRFTHEPTGQFLILSDTTVLASSGWADPDSGFTVLRDPMLVRAFMLLFDATFERGVPNPEGPSRRDGHDLELLRLMAEGFKDEAIARYLGLSLRTVRRRVAEAMESTGVHTRFQLGLAVADVLGEDGRSPRTGRPTPTRPASPGGADR